MTRTVKVREAKTHLSALLAAVERGEDIVIARGDRPVAKLVALAPAGRRQLGGLDYHLGDEFFDELPADELAAWESVTHGRVLLDTHVLIWDVAEPERLSERAREVLQDRATDLLVSAASIWELATKTRLGKLANGEFVLNALPERMAAADMKELPVSIAHAGLAGELGWEHPDPFDRMLTAQSLVESAPVVTLDVRLHQREGLRTIW